ncbi:CPBP family intramembrane glutamic endopeptidase [Saliterribacillus persicus]|uniref:CAAX prenyl protease 2/Lysostaphin resistance protein A-like domain-containing protein n=1 Tax=Saliterribacillus persicus TaxID=930114 RepID=A0A368XFU7_9BACI|nr:type II CAAX endopeptidase family protein [Saliterribacillus persicus]RCW64884.1 hypothetical protein DFR57_11262 [Saliterribacillus persicus]
MRATQKEIIRRLSSKQLKIQVILSQFILLILASIGSFLVFSSWKDFLSLFFIKNLSFISLAIISAVIFFLIDLLMMKYVPKKYWDDEGINKKIFSSGNFFSIFFLCFIIAFVEEWLFRGVIQTQFGFIIASILFAIVHFRYLFKPLLFISIIVLSFWIGLVYEWSESLTITFTLHFIMDFSLALYIRYSIRGDKHDRK